MSAKSAACRLKKFKSRQIPTAVSQMARRIIDTEGGMRSKLMAEMVLMAKSSAGLKSGKNLRRPNQRYIKPVLMESKLTVERIFCFNLEIIWADKNTFNSN